MDTRKQLNEANFTTLVKAKTLLAEREAQCIKWEHLTDEVNAQVNTYEDLIFFYDTPEMNHKLTRAYNKSRHYYYIYYKIVNECDELEKAIQALESADCWL